MVWLCNRLEHMSAQIHGQGLHNVKQHYTQDKAK